MKDTSTILRSQRDALRNLPPEQFKSAILAIMDYEMDEIEITDDPVAACALGMAKPLIDKRSSKAEAGRKGGEAKRSKTKQTGSKPKQTEANVKQTEADTKQTEAKEERRNIKDKNIKDKKICMHFVPPTVEEVRAYIAEKGYSVDAERFVDFYESKGWMVGKNKMKDWKASVRTWARSRREERTAKGNGFNNFESSGADWDSIADQIMEAETWS